MHQEQKHGEAEEKYRQVGAPGNEGEAGKENKGPRGGAEAFFMQHQPFVRQDRGSRLLDGFAVHSLSSCDADCCTPSGGRETCREGRFEVGVIGFPVL
jgi:hypothetical protein